MSATSPAWWLWKQEAQAEKRGITIHQEITPDLYADVDETLFMRLWINLISNSIKYGKEGGSIRVVLRASESRIIGQVIDDGIGISPEALPKIWDRFYQVNPSRSDGSSSGLGLSMVKWIISAHNGDITADSVPGTRQSIYIFNSQRRKCVIRRELAMKEKVLKNKTVFIVAAGHCSRRESDSRPA